MPTIFCAMHWYRPSSSGRTSFISKLPPSTIRIRDTGLLLLLIMCCKWLPPPLRVSSKSNTIPSCANESKKNFYVEFIPAKYWVRLWESPLTFFHSNVGSGFPFGGPHSSRAVSPAATRVSFGSTRKSSRNTEKKKQEKKENWLELCTGTYQEMKSISMCQLAAGRLDDAKILGNVKKKPKKKRTCLLSLIALPRDVITVSF